MAERTPALQTQWWRKSLAAVLFLFGLIVLFISIAAVTSLIIGPRLHSDQELLTRYLQLSRPGYLHVTPLSHESNSSARHRRIRIESGIDTPDAVLTCQGLFIYHYVSPPSWDLAWDSAECTRSDETLRLARRILDGGSLAHTYALYGETQAKAVQGLLQKWLRQGVLTLSDIPGTENRAMLTE
ncbi:MAG: hypothetical protein J5I90_19300 [Caldilineales bacterium]|nr:hypothetical protein [Caldilineales bacterium]